MQILIASLRYCITCSADASFERPDCLDEHGLDCPEWLCVACGDAFVAGFADLDGRDAERAREVA